MTRLCRGLALSWPKKPCRQCLKKPETKRAALKAARHIAEGVMLHARFSAWPCMQIISDGSVAAMLCVGAIITSDFAQTPRLVSLYGSAVEDPPQIFAKVVILLPLEEAFLANIGILIRHAVTLEAGMQKSCLSKRGQTAIISGSEAMAKACRSNILAPMLRRSRAACRRFACLLSIRR